MDNSTHRRASELMAWVAAGSASDAERDFVEQHLQTCADCREEAAFHQRLLTGLQQGALEPHDGDPALQRLMARIDAGAPREEQPAPLAGARSWARWLVAAVVVQAVGLGAAGVALWERGTAPEYRTLSSSAAPAHGADIRLVPAATLDLASLQALLVRHSLVVVEVSADARRWGLAISGPVREPGPVVQQLRSEPGVLLAEPVVK